MIYRLSHGTDFVPSGSGCCAESRANPMPKKRHSNKNVFVFMSERF